MCGGQLKTVLMSIEHLRQKQKYTNRFRSTSVAPIGSAPPSSGKSLARCARRLAIFMMGWRVKPAARASRPPPRRSCPPARVWNSWRRFHALSSRRSAASWLNWCASSLRTPDRLRPLSEPARVVRLPEVAAHLGVQT